MLLIFVISANYKWNALTKVDLLVACIALIVPYVHLSSARLSLIFGTGQKHGAPTWWDARGTVGAHDILLMPRDNAKLLSVCINLAEMQPATRFTELNGNTLMFC
jgi:hypothetical protein